MGGSVAQDHHHWSVGVHPLGRAEVVDAVIGDDVCEIVLWKQESPDHENLNCNIPSSQKGKDESE
jgi:hypothetical protein